jgi:prepilin-type N-terminal cleavage/methylation domain-containing protein
MRLSKRSAGFTVIEMVTAVAIIATLSVICYVLVGSYREHRMSEQAAKVLMQAAEAQEAYFAKEHQYFDAEVSGNGEDVYLTTPKGGKTSVHIPPRVILSLRARGTDKTGFVGHAFYSGSKILHRYDSRTGKMSTVERSRDETG